jgi:hypothetical protein
MQCHFCDSEADVTVEKDGITVGACTPHFREQLEELADTEWLRDVAEDVDVDGVE